MKEKTQRAYCPRRSRPIIAHQVEYVPFLKCHHHTHPRHLFEENEPNARRPPCVPSATCSQPGSTAGTKPPRPPAGLFCAAMGFTVADVSPRNVRGQASTPRPRISRTCAVFSSGMPCFSASRTPGSFALYLGLPSRQPFNRRIRELYALSTALESGHGHPELAPLVEQGSHPPSSPMP